jgi:DNA-binding transcriptional MocR family regulator
MLAVQALVDAGDEVVAVTPVWPNLVAQPEIMGARVRCVSLQPVDGAWQLDMDVLLAAVTAATKVLSMNAPNNPTGWTLTRDEQRRIADHCRATGTWILADEVYERLYFEAGTHGCAPSFLDVCTPDDRLVVVHSFSKSFLMTGWRLGWLVMPAAMTPHMGKLIELDIYSFHRYPIPYIVSMLSNVWSIAWNLRRIRFTCDVIVLSSSTTLAASISCCRFLTWPGFFASACTIQNSVSVSPSGFSCQAACRRAVSISNAPRVTI